MSTHPNSEFTEILTDTIHYPEIAKAYSEMSLLDQVQLDADLEDCINKALEYQEDDIESREEAAFDDGYNEGSNDYETRFKKDVRHLISRIESLCDDSLKLDCEKMIELSVVVDELEALL